MNKKELIKWIEDITKNILSENELELFDIEYVKEGPNYYLRVFIDKIGGADVKDCEVISRFLSKELDEKDPIINSYVFEVGTPGADRPLRNKDDYEKYKNQDIDIKLYKTLNGKKEFTGKLLGLEDDKVILEVDDKEIILELKQIASSKLAIIF